MMVCVPFHDSSPVSFFSTLSKFFADSLRPAPRPRSLVESLLQLLHCLIDRERGRPLTRREFLVRLKVLADEDDAAGHRGGVAELPVVIGIRGDVRPFVWVGP